MSRAARGWFGRSQGACAEPEDESTRPAHVHVRTISAYPTIRVFSSRHMAEAASCRTACTRARARFTSSTCRGHHLSDIVYVACIAAPKRAAAVPGGLLFRRTDWLYFCVIYDREAPVLCTHPSEDDVTLFTLNRAKKR